ncbi:hypothetical protein ACN27G_01730 [Plantactinospora sp. WMMB334]|uniref:hypothetical protein n=1 Tax=unclassified Plantactinospora TaxID=2631981 RepID=UPI003B94E93C
MEPPTAFVVALGRVNAELHSAGPVAPPVPHAERPGRTRAVRVALAHGLIRAARLIEPA